MKNNRVDIEDDKIVKVKIYNLFGQLISEDLDLSVLNEGLYTLLTSWLAFNSKFIT